MKTDIHNHLLRTVTPVQVISLDNYQRKQWKNYPCDKNYSLYRTEQLTPGNQSQSQ